MKLQLFHTTSSSQGGLRADNANSLLQQLFSIETHVETHGLTRHASVQLSVIYALNMWHNVIIFFLALTHGGALKTLQVTLATCPLFLRVQLNVCAPDNESNGSRMVVDAHDYLTFTTSEAYHGQQLLLHGLWLCCGAVPLSKNRIFREEANGMIRPFACLELKNTFITIWLGLHYNFLRSFVFIKVYHSLMSDAWLWVMICLWEFIFIDL